jgi:single-strand DNA-binding protein
MNTVNLIGRTTADPELRFTGGGTPVCTFRLAVNTPPRDGKDQPAMFVDVISFGAQAEAIAGHVGKGRQLGVGGRLSYRQWQAEDGSTHSKHEVIANHVEFLARPAGATNGSDSGPDYADYGEPV